MSRADDILQRAKPFLLRPVVPPSHPLAGEHGFVIDKPLPTGCGIGSDGKPMGYACPRNDCPTKAMA